MKIANNLYKVELKKSEEAVTGKIGLGWMTESMRHFGLKKMVSDEHREEKRSNRQKGAYEKIMTGAMMYTVPLCQDHSLILPGNFKF